MDFDLDGVVKAVAVGLVLVALHQVYHRLLLPRPIRDIPHNAASAQRLLGDLPELQKIMASTQDIQSWLLEQTRRLKSPLIQLFLDPLGKPIVVLSDPREALDLLLYRSRDFDRTPMVQDVFSGLSPTHHITMSTGPEWKRHRNLVKHLVITPFLQDIAAPAIHASVVRLVELWSIKGRVSRASAACFAPQKDFQRMVLDTLLEISFGRGFPKDGISSQIELLQDAEACGRARVSSQPQIIAFPESDPHEFIRAHGVLSEAIEKSGTSLFPRQSWWLMSKLPQLAHALRVKRRVTREWLETAVSSTVGAPTDSTSELPDRPQSSVEFMIRHERDLAKQESRKPDYLSPAMEDELYGSIFGASHSTVFTLAWGVKLLSDHPHVQSQLRECLRAAFPEALTAGRPPSALELATRTIPYLYATVEEMLRFTPTAFMIDRIATRDTELLGYAIPKGTCVWALSSGPGFTSPAWLVPSDKRSSAVSRTAMPTPAAKPDHARQSPSHEWAGDDLDRFVPERWLVAPSGADGPSTFDPNAGPTLAFGAGLRGCFGRPLAQLQLRMTFALLVWHFELRPCPAALATYAAVDGLFRQPKHCFVALGEPLVSS
ncbi:cytochrome P450 [Aspergillus saccharolyticus JOP 1030-1]|uniref:Cytochrome P450 n=1 Tax=Aspergillus saccharolyticus JOP 1030-1 TaxID=1450539 RepID=A0A318ZNV1_9EURO|nr:cytochrome P450 [Aspergillus saccharolyticus JOP 1030-1]PYH49301.1 cytochrome P450 [Aspergillus saccharolyticus JOP 1030-1]